MDDRMKIVILEGSPNRNGSSNMLAEEFIKGAREAGHGSGKGLRDSVHDCRQQIYGASIQAWQGAGLIQPAG